MTNLCIPARIVAAMSSALVLATKLSCSLSSAPKRSALRRTCPADSSPLTYNVGSVRAMAAVTCNNNVLLPMPGCPASRITPPGRIPPPKTVSRSAIPVLRRTILSSALIERNVCASRTLPLVCARATTDFPVSSVCSTNEFHSPQFSHFPVHLPYVAPQC